MMNGSQDGTLLDDKLIPRDVLPCPDGSEKGTPARTSLPYCGRLM